MSLKGKPYLRPDSRGDRYPLVETEKNHCLTDRCRGLVHKKKEHSPYCTGCRRRMWRAKNPLKYAFGNLRRRAKQRGKDFSLTFDQYRVFAERTDYARLRGKTSLSLSIDRIDNGLGYHVWNISALQLSYNSRKSFVPYFNGGVMPERERGEYLELERKYSDPLKKIVAELGSLHGFGTKMFWRVFNERKAALYEHASA